MARTDDRKISYSEPNVSGPKQNTQIVHGPNTPAPPPLPYNDILPGRKGPAQ